MLAMRLSKGNGASREWNHRDVYLTHVDRDLGPGFGLTGRPFLASDVRRHLVLYSLLYDKLIVPDASTLYNREFEAAIRYPPSQLVALLDEKVIVPAVRSNVPTFVELEESLRDADTWKARDRDDARRWAEYLDIHVGARREMGIELAQAGPRFTQLTDGVLETRESAERVGLGGVWDELRKFIETTRKDAGEEIVRRTTFYEFADQLMGHNWRASRDARLMSSAVYYRNASELLRVTPAMAGPFATTLERVEGSGGLRDPDLDRAMVRTTTLELEFDVWDLSALDAEAVLTIRSEKDFKRFLAAMADARGMNNRMAALEKAERALTEYLRFLDDQLRVAAIGGLSYRRKLRQASKLVSYVHPAGEMLISYLAWKVGTPDLNKQLAEFLWRFGSEATGWYVQLEDNRVTEEGWDAADRRREERGGKRALGQSDER